MKNEVVYKQLTEKILPFWNAMRDDENGGFYGYMSEDLHIDDHADKGCILNSRILWFYSTAYMYLQDEKLLDNAKHAFEFLKTYCFDPMCGGIFWSVRYNGEEHLSNCVPDGVMLGQMYDDIFVVKTFITYDMCRGLQQKEFEFYRGMILNDEEMYNEARAHYVHEW